MFWASLLVASSTVAASVAPSISNPEKTTEALLALAEGVQALQNSKAEVATRAFNKAIQISPNSAIAHHHLAISLAMAKKYESALDALNLAHELGSRSAEGTELKAMILSRLGKTKAALIQAKATRTFAGQLIAVTLNDGPAMQEVAHKISEVSERGLLASGILAASAARRGKKVQAINLLKLAEEYGHQLAQAEWADGVRALRFRIREQVPYLSTAARLQTRFDHVKNPEFQAAGEASVRSAIRLSMNAEASFTLSLDAFRIDTALFALQRRFLVERAILRPVEISGFAWASAISVPVQHRPFSPRVGMQFRVRDLYAQSLAIHYANSIEAGPFLQLPFSGGLQLDLGFLGVATDFIDKSPPDEVVSSQNRDIVGQRALMNLSWWADVFRGQFQASFFRDDARGAAFDVNGGSLSLRILTDLSGGLFLRTGAGLSLRRFGPVGEAAILGSAAIRNEIRLYGELAVLVHLTPWLRFALEDRYLQNAGRSGHAYTDNILSVSAQVVYE